MGTATTRTTSVTLEVAASDYEDWQRYADACDGIDTLSELVRRAVEARMEEADSGGRSKLLCTCGRSNRGEDPERMVDAEIEIPRETYEQWHRFVGDSGKFGSLKHLLKTAIVVELNHEQRFVDGDADGTDRYHPLCTCARAML